MVYFTLGNKGGIGKTTISAYIAEFLTEKGKDVLVIDTDPENHTMLQYKFENTQAIDIKDSNNNIDKRSFDSMLEIIFSNKDKDIVIDNGSSTFNAIATYMVENDVLDFFKDEGVDCVMIGIVAGAGNLTDSLQGFKTITENFNTNFILFNNQYDGETVHDGITLTDSKAYKSTKNQIIGVINIEHHVGYFAEDIKEMTQYRLRFSDLQTNDRFTMAQKRRLSKYRDKIWEQLETVIGANNE